jgi:hypothetical protein
MRAPSHSMNDPQVVRSIHIMGWAFQRSTFKTESLVHACMRGVPMDTQGHVRICRGWTDAHIDGLIRESHCLHGAWDGVLCRPGFLFG